MQIIRSASRNRPKPASIFFYGLILFGLYLTSLYSYLLFHSLAEVFSIVIGVNVFIIAWNSRQRLDNNYLLFLGIACLFVSVIDLIHTLAYKGMGVFSGYDANLPTQLWIAARYTQGFSLLISPVFLRKKLNVELTFLVFSVVIALLLWSIFAGIFPDCFIEGRGLTPFKIASEYIISLTILVATILLIRKRDSFDGKVLNWLLTFLILMIAAELTFTSYISVYGFSNLLGHFFKMIAFYFVYKALAETGIEKPHRLLFRDLKQSEIALRAAFDEVQRLAITDTLTGLYNRRYFFELFDYELERARRYRHSLSVIMLDIDHFKQVNDKWGHPVGDQVLHSVAECCRTIVRKVDVVGRYGGDEFCIILPESELNASHQVAERLRGSIAGSSVDTKAGQVKVTASLGIVTLDTEHSTADALLAFADQALYRAKENGRNCVSSHQLSL